MSNDRAYAGKAQYEDGDTEIGRLRRVIRSVANRIATITVVQVVAVDSQTVDVNPLVAQLDGAGNAMPHGVVHDLPVVRMFGGGNGIIVPVKVGDIGVALFAHTDISSVKVNKAPSNPGSRRRFDYADGMYLPGILNADPTQFLRIAGAGIEMTADVISTSGALAAGNGVSGTFTDGAGKVVTVADGIIIGIA